MLYPEDTFMNFWDIYIAFFLIFSCLVTPYRLALVKEDSENWKIVNGFIDIMFLIDIILIFQTTYYDEEFNLITSRKTIACNYLQGWFTIDFVAIVPFELILGGGGGGNVNNMVRIARIGKMYKLVKLTKLIRVAKMARDKSKLFKFLQKFLKIRLGLQRLVSFVLSFFILIHIVACLWIMTANMGDSTDGTWMEGDISAMSPGLIYLTSIYFTVTTITTVGYGDMSIITPIEKVFCIFCMIIGVLAFSFASGSLSSILSIYDFQNAKYKEQLTVLNKIHKEYKMDLVLYANLKAAINH